MCLRSISGAKKKWGRFIRFGTTAAPLEPDLVWNDTDTGGTKVRDHPKALGSCASAVMVGLSYRDIYDLFLMLMDVIPILLPLFYRTRGSLAGIDLFENTHYGHNRHMTGYIYVWKEQIHK